MALNIQSKQAIVDKINNIAKSALSAVVVNSCGVSTNKMTELRKAGREVGVHMYVARNTLLRKAVTCTAFECLKSTFIGPTLIAFSMKHPNSAARLFKEFIKTDIKFEIKAAAFDGKIISALQIDRLVNLPTYKEAIVYLIIIIKEISIGRLVRTLTTVYRAKEIG